LLFFLLLTLHCLQLQRYVAILIEEHDIVSILEHLVVLTPDFRALGGICQLKRRLQFRPS